MLRALVTSQERGLGNVEALEVAAPEPSAGEARITMAFAPVNPADLLLVHGRHVFRPELPSPIGIEGAGIVDAVGPGGDPSLVGRKVAVPFGGTWSEQLVLDASALLVLPDDADLEQAAMLSVNPVTALGLLDGVPAGATILQNAAASAVGQLVIRLAKRRGIRTINVVRRASQVDPLRALGADVVLVGDDDLAARTRPYGTITRALDAVAGASSGALLSALPDGGTLVVYGLLSEDRVILPAQEVVFRDVTVRGYTRLRSMRAMSQAARASLQAASVALLAEGDLASIEARFPLRRVTEALAADAREGRSGKILLDLRAG